MRSRLQVDFPGKLLQAVAGDDVWIASSGQGGNLALYSTLNIKSRKSTESVHNPFPPNGRIPRYLGCK